MIRREWNPLKILRIVAGNFHCAIHRPGSTAADTHPFYNSVRLGKIQISLGGSQQEPSIEMSVRQIAAAAEPRKETLTQIESASPAPR